MLMRFAVIAPGMVIEAGPRTVTEAEIIEFASRYDPQWFHTDPRRAAGGRWKGLIASGWHSGAIMMELAVESIFKDSESFGSPGIEKLEWLKPGDALRLRVLVLETHRSSSGLTGIVSWRWELFNQTHTRVMSLIATSLFAIEAEGGA